MRRVRADGTTSDTAKIILKRAQWPGGFTAAFGSTGEATRTCNLEGASVINCYYAVRGIGVSSLTTKTVDFPDLTFSDTHRKVAGGKIW